MLSELTPEDLVDMDQCRARVGDMVKSRTFLSLKRTPSDLRLLQKVIDERGRHGPMSRRDYRCMGVCFGDVLASVSPLRWVMVNDEHGRDPTLRWNDTSVQINATWMILKRIMADEPVDLAALAAQTLRVARERAALEE
ncbi:MAG: DUF3806 domain-containing protein [Hyphomonadaceae bacterium]|nr:DUF3806 domain-containing protein [Hyphomonadaceae bacterium]